jgi:small subunit ribosomal protein S6
MRFDSSAQTQDAVRKTLGLDPRMIRFSVVKLGRTLEEVGKVGGGVEWRKGLKEYREAMGIR